MSNYETYVSPETAKLLKQAGFDWEVSHWYADKPDDKELYEDYTKPMNANQYMDPYHYYQAFSAPTLAVAQRWIREVKHEYVGVHPIVSRWFYSIHRPNFGHYYKDKQFNTYEEAQEAGIKKALELILEKGE